MTYVIPHIEDYGAVPNNAALGDANRDAIQAAHDDVLANQCELQAGRGVYWVGGPLYFEEMLNFRGVDTNATFIRATDNFTAPNDPNMAVIIFRNAGVGATYNAATAATNRVNLSNLQIHGNGTVGGGTGTSWLNGVLASFQQPARWRDVRIHKCNGYGLHLVDTQQVVMENTEITYCGTGLSLRTAKMVYFYGLNIERCLERAVVVDRISALSVSSGRSELHIWGYHGEPLDQTEMPPNAPEFVYFDVKDGDLSLSGASIGIGVTQKFTAFRFAGMAGTIERGATYGLRDIIFTGNPASAYAIIDDVDRGTLLNDLYFRGHLNSYQAGPANYPHATTNPHGTYAFQIAGRGKRKIKIGAPDTNASFRHGFVQVTTEGANDLAYEAQNVNGQVTYSVDNTGAVYSARSVRTAILSALPSNPLEGEEVICDGIGWNPVGDGQKHKLIYLGGTWKKLD